MHSFHVYDSYDHLLRYHDSISQLHLSPIHVFTAKIQCHVGCLSKPTVTALFLFHKHCKESSLFVRLEMFFCLKTESQNASSISLE